MRARTTLLLALFTMAIAAACDPQEPDAPPQPDGGSVSKPDAGTPPGDPCARVTREASDLQNYDALVECLRSDRQDSAKQVARSTFVATAESRQGFPIVAEERVVFVYLRDSQHDEGYQAGSRNEPIRIAGSFNAWDGTDAALEREGSDFFHRSFRMIPGQLERWSYKLVAKDSAGQDVWFADPMARRFDYDENGRYSIVRGDQVRGHLERLRAFHSSTLGNDRDIDVYVPRGYDWDEKERYPVLYMHDGNNLFDPSGPFGSWKANAIAETEIAAGRALPFFIVSIPNNANRFGEYTHTRDMVDGQVVGGDGDRYADFVATELKPAIDAQYRTEADRDHTAVLGSSLGGLISFHIGMRYPQTFKYVGGMSSTFAWGADMGNPTMVEIYSQAADLGSRGQVYYLDSGGGPDGGCPEGYWGGSDNYCDTLKMKQVLESKGITTYPDDPNAEHLQPDGIDIYHWHEAGAEHNEAAWNARLWRPLRLFFRP